MPSSVRPTLYPTSTKFTPPVSEVFQSFSVEETLRMRVLQHQAISELGMLALSGIPVYELMNHATEKLHEVLKLDFTKILQLMPDRKRMVLRAGKGWKRSIKPHITTVDTGKNSQAGFTLLTNQPVIVEELEKEHRFNGPKLLQSHKVVSGMSVIIYGQNNSIYGVLGVHTKRKRIFTQDDIHFLQSVANTISLAIQREQTERELRRSQTIYKALYEADIIGVILVDLKGEILEANDAFLHMLGYTTDDIVKKTLRWDALTPVEYKQLDDRKILELNTTGIATPWEKEYIRKDGSHVHVIVGCAVLNEDTSETIAFVLDNSERKQMEQRKDEFIGIASHELKTPLTSIKGYVQILERIIHELGNERANQYIAKTNVYINRLHSLISDLLDVSKIQAGKLEFDMTKFNLRELIQESIDSIQPTSKSHQIQVQSDPEITVKGDRRRLEQVIVNLLSNAIKYSPRSDRVVVRVKENRDSVIVSVQDFGVGIPPKHQEKIFERFYRAERTAHQFSGLGIGLYISKEIINRHGGKIWLKSQRGQGSTFTFSIPKRFKRSSAKQILNAQVLQ